MIADQLRFHGQNARRSHTIEHRLHSAGLVLLALTLVACVVHLVHGLRPALLPLPHSASRLLTCMAALLPAAGAALAGINNQGEFLRISKRSAAMERQLSELRQRVSKLSSGQGRPGAPTSRPSLTSTEVIGLTMQTAQLMVTEVLDWRVVILDRPLVPTA
jgi:hypothetical protein